MMTMHFGPLRDPTTAAEAVAAAFAEDGIKAEHVATEAIDAAAGVWRWRLVSDAPVVLDRDTVTVDVDVAGRGTSDARHPAISDGVAVDDPEGWFVATGDEDEASQVEATRQYVIDLFAGPREHT